MIETMWTESDLSVIGAVLLIMYLPHVRGGQPQARDISLPSGMIPFYLIMREKSTAGSSEIYLLLKRYKENMWCGRF